MRNVLIQRDFAANDLCFLDERFVFQYFFKVPSNQLLSKFLCSFFFSVFMLKETVFRYRIRLSVHCICLVLMVYWMHNSFYVRCSSIWVLYFSEMRGYIRVMDHNARLRSLVVMEMNMNGRHVSVSWRLVRNGAQTRILCSHPQTFTMKMMYVLVSSDVSEFLSDVI